MTANLPPRIPAVVLSMSLAELRSEWRAQEDVLIAHDADLARIADAVWPDEDSERPADLEEVTADALIAGINSLHDLLNRLYAENELLRQRPAVLGEEERHG